MSYELRQDEAVAPGLKRIVRTELGSALEQLHKGKVTDEAIHEARKSIKKVRAVLQLVGHKIDARRARKRLRRAGHLLAPIRDAEAVIVSAGDLCTSESASLPPTVCLSLQRRLRRDKGRVATEVRRDHVEARSRKALKKVRKSTKAWRWDNAGKTALLVAVQQSYSRAQLGMRAAARDADCSETFHEWRKRVKGLWYALRLLNARIPGLERHLVDLEHVETWLGEEHNLCVLSGRVGDSEIGHPIRAAAKRRRRALRQRALATGVRVFSETPTEFAGHMLKP